MAKPLKNFIYPGKLSASKIPYHYATILGSCVAICLWDPVKHIGGMNHYMLPYWNGEGLASPKYGNIAIEKLIRKLLYLGSKKKDIKAKIFGGASVIASTHDLYNIGERNIQIAEEMLEAENIKIIAKSVGGHLGRKILMDTSNFQIKHRFIQKKNINL